MNISCYIEQLWYKLKYFYWRTVTSKPGMPVMKNVNMFSDGTNVYSDRDCPVNAKVIFIGDSITYLANWSKAFPNAQACNFGVGGDTTAKVLARLGQLGTANPEKIFLRIGINNLQDNLTPCEYIASYRELVRRLKVMFPTAKLHLLSLLPIGKEFDKLRFDIKRRILAYNQFIQGESFASNAVFIDDFRLLVGYDGWCTDKYLNDGIHPSVDGYMIIFNNLVKYIR
jgi:lysophospholipase L1-like esterase